MATSAKRPYVVPEGVPVAEHEVGSGWMTFAGVAFLIGAGPRGTEVGGTLRGTGSGHPTRFGRAEDHRAVSLPS